MCLFIVTPIATSFIATFVAVFAIHRSMMVDNETLKIQCFGFIANAPHDFFKSIRDIIIVLFLTGCNRAEYFKLLDL